MQDLQTKDPSSLFVMIAQRMTTMGAGSDKAGLAVHLFGKAGAELIPMLNDVGANMDKTRAQTKALGLTLSDDMVSSAQAAQGAVHNLELIGQGLATQFDAGFMPRFAAGVNTFAQSITGVGVPAMKTFGTTVGNAFTTIVGGILKAGIQLEGFWEKQVYDAQAFGTLMKSVAASVLTGKSGGLGDYMLDRDREHARIDRQTNTKVSNVDQSMRTNLRDAQSATFGANPTGIAGDGTAAGEAAKARQKQLEEANKTGEALNQLQQAKADNELAILRAKNTAEEQVEKQRYDAGEITLQQYYEDRAKRITDAYDAETAVIAKKIDAAEKAPTQGKDKEETAQLQIKQVKELQKLTADLDVATTKYGADMTANTAQRAAAEKSAGEKMLQDEQKLATMVGDRHKASQLALEQELATYADLLKKQGESDAAVASKTADFATRGNAKIAFGELQDQASATFGDLDRSVSGINAQAAAGAISQIAATGQIIGLERQRLPVLDGIITKMEEQARISGDPAQVQAVAALREQYAQLSVSVTTVQTAGTYLQNQMQQFVSAGLVDFFTEGISGAKSFGDALGDLANTFEQMVARMIAKMIIYYAFAALLGWLMPGSSDLIMGSLFPGGPFGGGKAGGGNVRKGTTYLIGEKGPELMTMGGDAFITPHDQSMAALSAASTIPNVHTAASISSAAAMDDGGGSTAGQMAGNVQAQAAPVINITTPPGTQAQTKQSTGSNGQSITKIIITAVTTDIARGGATAKVIQGQYGLTRQATVR